MRKEIHKSKNVKIAVIGIGDTGRRILNFMIERGIYEIDYIALDYDLSTVEPDYVKREIIINKKHAKEPDKSSDLNIRKVINQDSSQTLQKILIGYDFIFSIAAIGGGTDHGILKQMVKISKNKRIFNIVVFIEQKFLSKNKNKDKEAKDVENIEKYFNTIINVPKKNIKNESGIDALKISCDYIYSALKSIIDLILINFAFDEYMNEIKLLINNKRISGIGIGTGKGENCEIEAFKKALSAHEMKNKDSKRTIGILAHFLCNSNIGQEHVCNSVEYIKKSLRKITDLMFCAIEDDSLGDESIVTLINLCEK